MIPEVCDAMYKGLKDQIINRISLHYYNHLPIEGINNNIYRDLKNIDMPFL